MRALRALGNSFLLPVTLVASGVSRSFSPLGLTVGSDPAYAGCHGSRARFATSRRPSIIPPWRRLPSLRHGGSARGRPMGRTHTKAIGKVIHPERRSWTGDGNGARASGPLWRGAAPQRGEDPRRGTFCADGRHGWACAQSGPEARAPGTEPDSISWTDEWQRHGLFSGFGFQSPQVT